MITATEIVDRAVALVDPARAARRAAARRVLAYTAGQIAPRDREWNASRKGPNAEVRTALSWLRRRSREFVRDNAFASRMLAMRVAHEIGYGITPRSITGEPDVDAGVIALWNRFVAKSDLHGRLDFYGQQIQAARCRSEAGEVLVRLVRVPLPEARRLRLPVPLQLEVLEPDVLDDAPLLAPLTEALRVSDGIEFDRQGRRVAYRLLREHPGEGLWAPMGGAVRYDRVPAQDVIHLYRAHQQRPGQVRGVPDLAPAMMRLRRLEEYEEAAVERAKVEALLGVFYETAEPLDTTGTAPGGDPGIGHNGGPPIEIFPGMAAELPVGTTAKFLQPGTSGPFEPFAKHELRAIAAGYGVPYDLATGDLSDTNYSSMRGGKVAFKIAVEQDQWAMYVPLLCQPVWEAFVEAAILSGALPERRGGYPVAWNPPPFQMLDPGKEIPPMVDAVRAGFATWDQTVSGLGFDPEVQVREIAASNARFDKVGLILTSDPRRTAGTGAAQDAKQNAAVEIGATGAAVPRQTAATAA